LATLAGKLLQVIYFVSASELPAQPQQTTSIYLSLLLSIPIPERLRGAFTTRRYTNPRLPLPLPIFTSIKYAESELIINYYCRL